MAGKTHKNGAAGGGEVVLRKDRCRWNRLPQQIRFRLVNGTVTVREIREDIARSAKISTMPPVQVFPEVWLTPNQAGTIYGSATILRIGGVNRFGVRLAGPTVFLDRRTIRRILVHEFGHSFRQTQLTVDGMDEGRTSASWVSSDVYEDDAFERGMQLQDPGKWFGDKDANDMMHWHDEDLRRYDDTVVKLANYLPTVTPDINFRADRIGIDQAVIDHVRSLRSEET